jgi:hypothetical protein
MGYGDDQNTLFLYKIYFEMPINFLKVLKIKPLDLIIVPKFWNPNQMSQKGESIIKAIRGTKVKVFFQGLHMT